MSWDQNLSRQWKTKSESGQSLVEFALVMVFVILPLTMIFIESSFILYEYVALSNAAREGARAGSISLFIGSPSSTTEVDNHRASDIAATVSNMVRPLIPPPPDCNGTSSTTTCQITYGPPSALFTDPLRSTDAMTVTLVYRHAFLFGALGNQIDVRARSSMRIEPSTVISGTGP